MLCARPFSGVRPVLAPACVVSPGDAADGRHALRMGPPAGRGVRAAEFGPWLSVRDDPVPESPPVRPRISEHDGNHSPASRSLGSRIIAVPETGPVSQQPGEDERFGGQALRVEIASPYRAPADSEKAVSRRPIHPHGAASIRHIRVHRSALARALGYAGVSKTKAWPAAERS